MHRNELAASTWYFCFLNAFILLPAVAMGVFAMIAEGVSPVLWGQQAAACIVFALLGLLRKSAQKVSVLAWTAICLIALAATLFFPAVGGAKRWLDLGIFNVNAGMLVLPALLVLLGGMKYAYPIVFFCAAVLCVQPDFSQLTAFSLGVLPILWKNRKNVYWTTASVMFLMACMIRCVNVPTALEPVAYCEGILAMLGHFSPLMQMIGGLALVLIPGYFVCRFLHHRSEDMLPLAIYYAVTILFSMTGEYPVPFMGFGLSPIMGYWLAYLIGCEAHE